MDSKQKNSLRLLILLLVLVLTACQPSRPGPMAWIDFPFDGAVLRSGETVAITGHTSSLDGTSEVILFVDGAAQLSIAPEDTTADFVRVDMPWTPPEDGDYTLQLRMVSGEGDTAVSDPVRIRVGRVLVEVDTESLEDLSLPPEPEITPTEPEVTEEVVPPTTTPTVYIPPTNTPTVKPPADTTPPDVPTPMVPVDGLVIGCASTQNLVWLPVEDIDNLNGYDVRLERELSPGNWDRVGNYGPIKDKQYEVTIDCGVAFRWSVRAEDKAGNKSDWSAWSSFIVELD